MRQSSIYSIGHGNKSIEDFIKELREYSIAYVIDVRSKPYSRWNPQFNQPKLQSELEQAEITYVFMGDTLGGLPADQSCFDNEGKVVYEIVKSKAFFQDGLERLLKAHSKRINLAIMCSEAKPEECHRSKLIGRELLIHSVSVNHIVTNKKIKSQAEVMNEITKGKGEIDLFGNEVSHTSRKSY